MDNLSNIDITEAKDNGYLGESIWKNSAIVIK